MTLEEAKRYDELLRQLSKDGKRTSVGVPRGSEAYDQWHYLQSKGVVTLITGGGKIALASLTPQGIAFVADGGFEKRYRDAQAVSEEKKHEHRSRSQGNRIAIWSIAITATVAIAGILKEELSQLITWLASLLR